MKRKRTDVSNNGYGSLRKFQMKIEKPERIKVTCLHLLKENDYEYPKILLKKDKPL